MCLPKYFKIHYWPGFTFGLFMCTMLLTYLMAVLSGHVYGFFPYISDAAALPPESCIFGQLYNIGALSMGITLYIRYRQVDFEINSGHCDFDKKWNKIASICLGFICLGISMVGNFQVIALEPLHFVGALFIFGPGTLYFIIQTRISFACRTNRDISKNHHRISKNMLHLRTLLTLCIPPLFIVCGICLISSRLQFKGKSLLRWTEEDGGFQIHLISTFTEWFLVLFMLIYVASFTNEFKSLQFEEFKFTYKYSTVLSRNIEIA